MDRHGDKMDRHVEKTPNCKLRFTLNDYLPMTSLETFSSSRGSTNSRDFSSRVSLRWVRFAWLLFRSSILLWMVPAAVLTLASLFCGLLVTGHLHPVALHPGVIGASAHVIAAGQDRYHFRFSSSAFAGACREHGYDWYGELHRARWYHQRSRPLPVWRVRRDITGAGHHAAGGRSRLFDPFCRKHNCTRPAPGSQSGAVRDSPISSCPLGFRNCDPERPCAYFGPCRLRAADAHIGDCTGGLGLLAAIPVVKIIGAFADAYAEARGRTGSFRPRTFRAAESGPAESGPAESGPAESRTVW